jgi:hypothetical protein
MTYQEFDVLLETHHEAILGLCGTKGADYSNGEDRLSNFKLQAKSLGLTPYQVWGVYANKHWDAVNTFIRNNGQVESEPIESRIHDIILYSYLLLGLIKDQDEQ